MGEMSNAYKILVRNSEG